MLKSEALPSSYGPVTGWAESQAVSGLWGMEGRRPVEWV